MTLPEHPLSSSDSALILDRLDALIRGCESVYIKKLALNDWQWASNPDAHQNGFYVPKAERDSGFFPKQERKLGPKGGAVNETTFAIEWPQAQQTETARLVNYPSKGEETHLTRIPKSPFLDIPPASTLILGKRRDSLENRPRYEAFVIHAETQAAEWIREFFDLSANYHSEVCDTAAALAKRESVAADFIALAWAAFQAGEFTAFSTKHASMPDTARMSEMAQARYLTARNAKGLSPYEIENPGDTLKTLTQDIEWRLFLEFERNMRSVEVIHEIFGTDPRAASTESAFKGIIGKFGIINGIFKSAGQARKSRAGSSFENHILRMMADGKIPHESQVVMEGKRRPDFILPTFSIYKDTKRNHSDALVLSAKTTLRERWKQVHGEANNCDLYLATLDSSIALNAIHEMAKEGIRLVVPESHKDSKETVYRNCPEVISFSEFFQTELKTKRFPRWKQIGVLAP